MPKRISDEALAEVTEALKEFENESQGGPQRRTVASQHFITLLAASRNNDSLV